MLSRQTCISEGHREPAYLVRLRIVSFTLKIHLLLDACFSKYVVTTLYSLLKTETLQQGAEIIESN